VRVFEYLRERAQLLLPQFQRARCQPSAPSQEAIREELRRQMSLAEVVVALYGLYQTHADCFYFS
jgi:hypothetical protein